VSMTSEKVVAEKAEQSSPIDMTEALKIMDGDNELLQECLDDFVRDYPELLANIRDAINAGDADSLDKSAHRFKGTLKYLAAGDAADIAYELETMGKEGNLTRAGDRFEDLDKECRKLIKFIGISIL